MELKLKNYRSLLPGMTSNLVNFPTIQITVPFNKSTPVPSLMPFQNYISAQILISLLKNVKDQNVPTFRSFHPKHLHKRIPF